MKKILYCILHTEKNTDRYNNLIETWLKDIDFLFISDNENLDKRIIKVTDDSSYKSGQIKQINGLNYIKDCELEYDFYFFCDDDCFVNTKLMDKFILDCDKNSVWGQLCTCWSDDRTLNYPLGGAGILISKETLFSVSEPFEENKVIWGDVSLGLNLRKKNITMSHSDLFHSQSPSFYKIEDSDVRNHISFHYIKSKSEMEKLYQLCL